MIRTIEIDDNAIPQGYEPVAFRVPQSSDSFVVSTGGVAERVSAVPDGPRLIVRPTENTVSLACRGQVVLVANVEKGPYEQRMLVDISPVDRNYPYICEAIDHRLPHQCWRFAKRVGK